MKKLFIKFLKENNALIPYICNIYMHSVYGNSKGNETLSYILKRHKPHYWLWCFDSQLTSEGYWFWRDLQKKWVKARKLQNN